MADIEAALAKVPRKNFVPESLQSQADEDVPLPIGFGQTISQPTTVSYMLHWLNPQRGDIILDIGSGSGYTAALLSELVGPKGFIYAVERIPELLKFGRENCERLKIKNVEFVQAGKILGLTKHAPYDKILVSAATKTFPTKLLAQLKVGGKIVIPVGQGIQEITKTSEEHFDTDNHAGFVFVPLEIIPRD